MNKSYVSLEQAQCPICGNIFDTGSLIMDTRLRERFEMHTVTHNKLCKDCKKLKDDGFIALVEVTNGQAGKTLKPNDANRTGQIAHIKRAVWSKVFGSEPPDLDMVFVEKGVIAKLMEMQA